MKAISILLIVILSQGCVLEKMHPPENLPDVIFKISNSSNTDIYFTVSHNAENILIREPEDRDKIFINETKTDVTFESFFAEGRLLTIFIYRQSTIDNYTWQEIKDEGLFDERYDLTLDQLKTFNYEIVYVGN